MIKNKNGVKRFIAVFIAVLVVFSEVPYIPFWLEQRGVYTNLNIEVQAETVTTGTAITFSGEGTETSPFLISTEKELKEALAAIEGIEGYGTKYEIGYYKLTKDISLSGEDIHEGKSTSGTFNGTFDGDGHSISGVNTTALIRNAKDATIKNLTIKDSEFSVAAFSGDLGAGLYGGTTMLNCHLDTDVTINAEVEAKKDSDYQYIGGMITQARICKDCTSAANCNVQLVKTSTNSAIYYGGVVGCAEKVENCSFSGNIFLGGKYHNISIGGIIGSEIGWYADKVIFRCKNSGNIVVTADLEKGNIGGIGGYGVALLCSNVGKVTGVKNTNVGGIVGSGSVKLCDNEGEITGIQNTGGIAGAATRIYSSYNGGKVSGEENVGGIAGVSYGKIQNSYTYGMVSGNNTAKNIGIAIGDREKGDVKDSFYLEQAGQKGVGNSETISGLTGKSESELKAASTIAALNTEVDEIEEDYQCCFEWCITTQNHGYPVFEIDAIVCNDVIMRLISVYSPKKIYYAYLPLKTKSYVVQDKQLNEADLYEGKYYVDYSSIKTSKSACVGIALEKKKYSVEGFQCTQGTREMFVGSTYTYDNDAYKATYKTEKTEKKYQCLGSDFLSVIQVQEYPAKYTSKTSGVKFDYNWEDVTRRGAELIDTLNLSYWGDKESYSKNKEVCKMAKVTLKSGGGNYRFLSDFGTQFVWKKKGEERWREDVELNFELLKEYGTKGETLLLRFLETCEVEATKVVKTNGEEGRVNDEENSISEVFFGDAVTVKIPKLKKAAAPKIKVDIANMTVGIKNGMQISFDKNYWYTFYPYSSKAPFVMYEGGSYGSDGDGFYSTGYKISSLSLLDEDIDTLVYVDVEKNLGKDMYVRTLGKNNLPSEIATVHLPEKRQDAPQVVIAKEGEKYIVQDIQKAANDTVEHPEYEYYIDFIDSRSKLYPELEYDSYDTKVKWNALKTGMEIKEKLNTKYSFKCYYYDEEKMKMVTKNDSQTLYLGDSECGFDTKIMLVVRRKSSKKDGVIASQCSYYAYNASKDSFVKW